MMQNANRRDALFGAAGFVVGSLILAGMVAGALTTGQASQLQAFVIGGVAALFAVSSLMLLYRASVRRQLDRIRAAEGSEAIAIQLSSRTRRDLESSGLAPVFTLHNLAVTIRSNDIRLWTGLREPFAFGSIESSSVESIEVVGRALRLTLRSQRRAACTLELAPRSVDTPMPKFLTPSELTEIRDRMLQIS